MKKRIEGEVRRFFEIFLDSPDGEKYCGQIQDAVIRIKNNQKIAHSQLVLRLYEGNTSPVDAKIENSSRKPNVP